MQDLCLFLIRAGAKIEGSGTNVVTIYDGRSLVPKPHRVLNDHHEITTFLAISAATGGEIKVNGVNRELFEPMGQVFNRLGVPVEYKGHVACIARGGAPRISPLQGRSVISIKSRPWPGLPVDTLPLFIPLAMTAKTGQAIFHNWMYDAGLFWTTEFLKLGANVIMADPHRVIVTGGEKLRGGTLEAPYIIRAVVSIDNGRYGSPWRVDYIKRRCTL